MGLPDTEVLHNLFLASAGGGTENTRSEVR